MDKYYPVQGSNKFMTVSFPCTRAIAVDYGAQSTSNASVALTTFAKGTCILGFAVRFTETLVSTSAATVQFGFTATQLLTSALGSGAAVAGSIMGPIGGSHASSVHAFAEPCVLTADDTFDLILATDKPSAGKADIFIHYIPIPTEDISTAVFKSIVTT